VSIPFGYVSPEQVLKDKADYARKGIARGRALVAATYADGVVLCAENSSTTLHKVSEIYDRIAFAGVGRYNEFDSLRIAGVRAADLKGFSYSREDVDARSLANQYASIVGNVFTHELKPLEVEILVAEVGAESDGDQLFHITFDGTVVDDDSYSVLGGEADAIAGRMEEHWTPGAELAAALRGCVTALAGPDRRLSPKELEVAVLERGNGRRTFRRLDDDQVEQLLGAPASGSAS
jgi:proteasome alpha subunit